VIEFYPQIKMVHMTAVICSGLLFLMRGLMMQAGRGALANRPLLRIVAPVIDSVLLTAALALLTMLPSAMFANGWLWVKLALLVVYIVLGVQALRERAPPQRRRACFIAALAIFAFMISIARAHHPLGVFHGWFG
jgi:uncharacterized membrane protein SirB2